MRALGVSPTVHIYNELLLTCERNCLWDQALELSRGMRRDKVEPNSITQDLLSTISEKVRSSL
jgi:pentatricopeptide repeat protein